jgi:hypothetical protein
MATRLRARYGAGVTYGDIDVVADCGADPTWRTYCDEAFAAAVSGAQPGQTIGIPPGLYKTRRPIIAPPYVGWAGSPATPLVGSWAEYGSVIKPGPDWAPGDCPLSAVIALLDQATGGYRTRSEEQHFRNLLLSGSALPAGPAVHGIASLDRVSRVQLRDVHVGRMTGDGIHQEYPDDQPGGWTGFHVFSRYNAGHGYLLRSADSNWTKCLATNSGRDGWHLDTTGNTEYLGCRSEWSGRSGYRYTCRNNRTASGGVAFTGCRTDRSAAHGFLAAGGLAIPLSVTGCTFKRDGASGSAGGAGIRIRDFPGTVTITGCQVFPGLNDDGTGEVTPRQAIRVTGPPPGRKDRPAPRSSWPGPAGSDGQARRPAQNVAAHQGAGSAYMAADSRASVPGVRSSTRPAAARVPSLVPPR